MKFKIRDYEDIRKKVEEMSIRQLLSAVICPDYNLAKDTPDQNLLSVYGLNVVKLSGPVARNMMSGWMRYGTPAVFISYFDPYFGDDFYACTDTLINTYGYTGYTNDEIIRRLFDTKKINKGRIPF